MTTQPTPAAPPRRRLQYSLRALMAVMVLVAVVSAWVGWQLDQRRPARLIAQDFHQGYQPLIKVYRDEVVTAGPQQLDKLAVSRDPTLALAGGWQRVRRNVPFDATRDRVPARGEDLEAFLTLVEERLNLEPPLSWRETVLAAMWHTNWPSFTFDAADTNTPREADPAAAPTTKRRVGDSWIIESGDSSWRLPAQDLLLGGGVALLEYDEVAYIAVYQRHWANGYTLYAIDSQNKLLWSSQVWSDGLSFGMDDTNFDHRVSLRANERTVAVFGTTTNAFYVEQFDRHTGRALCRFCETHLSVANQ